MMKLSPCFVLTFVLLASCQQQGPPLSAVIVTPASNATVSGTTAVQVSVPTDSKVSLVRAYARGAGESGKGVLLGSANKAPYVISWATGSTPNGDGLSVYAVASGEGNTDGISDAVPVRVSNPDAPALNYLVTYNLPVSVQGVIGQSLNGQRSRGLNTPAQLPPRLDASLVTAPAGLRAQSIVLPQADPISEEPRDLAVEWAWTPYSGANGYDVLLSKTSLAGPYEPVRSQVAVPTGVQKHSQSLSGAKPGDTVYGAVAALSNNSQDKSSLSNAGTASFLQTQQSASPADKQVVQDGRPILSWTPLTRADSYLYFLCNKTCSDQDAKDLWTNYPKAQPGLSAFYPANLKALSSGTYSWWVAGVKFNAQGQAVAFSYSALRTLVVP